MSTTLTERVAQLFQHHPGEWIDAHVLLEIGGFGGWRTRISDCRVERGMVIENRTYKANGFTRSEYRYVPKVAA
jgi:hypothetical protein